MWGQQVLCEWDTEGAGGIFSRTSRCGGCHTRCVPAGSPAKFPHVLRTARAGETAHRLPRKAGRSARRGARGVRATGCAPSWALGTVSLRLSPQFDMQRITLEELKLILYHAFRDHLTMKDIENIISNEEESLQETSESCQTEFEGGRCPRVAAFPGRAQRTPPCRPQTERAGRRAAVPRSRTQERGYGVLAAQTPQVIYFLSVFSPNPAFLQDL